MPTYKRGLTWDQLEILAYLWARWDEWNLTWDELENLSFLEKNENKVFAVEPGEFLLQLHVRDARDFEVGNFTLEYDADILGLNSSAYQSQYGLATGMNPVTTTYIVSHTPGKLVLNCDKRADGLWTGLIALLRFTALRAGDARIRLY